MKNICKILIVDDDTDDREILRDAFMSLENSNHQYEFLESGDALLQYLEEFKTSLPDLIMLDLNMPGKGGRETLKEIKSSELYHHIPTVVFTTYHIIF
jgi:CheY-like chemotaxis protein